MGGSPKGLLPHPSGRGTLVEHAITVARLAGAEPVLVGINAAYDGLGLRMLDDAHAGVGPMGGLASLLSAAGPRDAFAIACDMPYLPSTLLERLRSAVRSGTDAVMPVRATGREPLCALYHAARVLPHVREALSDGRRGLRALAAERLAVVEVRLVGPDQRWLDDWDEPADVR